MEYYNVYLVWPDGVKEKMQMAFDPKLQLTKNQMAEATPTIANSLRAGATIQKYVKLRKEESTPKQKLAQKYGFILGSIMRAESQFKQVHGIFPNGVDTIKVNRAFALVDSQFAKLKRDISDCFKLAGLKIK